MPHPFTPPPPLVFPHRPPLSLDQPRLMGIVNVTPDSFSDGGQFIDEPAAVAHGLALAEAGADVLDVGGESTRPGAARLPAAVQIARVRGVIRQLREALNAAHPHVAISIDTTLSEVAAAAVAAGADMLNDISAGRDDPAMFELAAAERLPIVLMHMQGTPATMQQHPTYANVVAEVRAFLLERAAAARAAGVADGQIVLDPGIGFGKTVAHNLALLAHLDELVATGFAVLLGASRKGFIGKVSLGELPGEIAWTGVDPAGWLVTNGVADERMGGTCATTALGVAAGVRLFRVHDVPPNRQAAAVAFAIASQRDAAQD